MLKREFLSRLDGGEFDAAFEKMYGKAAVLRQRERYKKLFEEFERTYPEHEEIFVYSAPGRTEVGGNHTDHQHGCVLAASVELDAVAIAAFHDGGFIRIRSVGYPTENVSLDDLSASEEEKGGSAALIRGIAAGFEKKGVEIGGIDAVVTSDVLGGSGLSSSAAYEVLIGTMIDRHYSGGSVGAQKIAMIGQYAENEYFGKKSGLMDQMVSSVGGFVSIDFRDTKNPMIENCPFDLEGEGYMLFITDTKGSHADLSDDYSAVPAEMKQIAEYFGREVLREVDENDFYAALPVLREKFSHRAILRSAHFFGENVRAVLEAKALKNGDTGEFLRLINESGRSSENLLQNIYSVNSPHEQGLSIGLMISRRILGNDGASRVHGGGFAGTIQAFVPCPMAEKYRAEMDRVFGKGSCRQLRIRPVGGTEIA